jgi:hypothetical protein
MSSRFSVSKFVSREAKLEAKRGLESSVADKLHQGEKAIVEGVRPHVVAQLMDAKRRKGKGKQKGRLSVSDADEPIEGGGLMSASFARSLLDPNTVYRFRLIDFNSFASSGAGVLVGYISCDPATTSFSEWSSLINLFTEVRLVAARIHICNVNPHSDGYATGQIKSDVAMNFNDLSVATAPSSVLAVLDNAHSWLHPLGKSTASVYSAMVSKNRQFASTATPSPGPYAGCTGQFSFYQTALTASTTYFDYFLECEFEFRNRD